MSYIIIECENCKQQERISRSEFDFEIVESNERPMGAEVMYEGTIETSCINGHPIEITHQYWEYPAGVESHKDTETLRASIITNKL